jgi:hypothetical protein
MPFLYMCPQTLYKKHDEVVKPQPLKPVDQNGMPKEALKGADSVAKGPPLVSAAE